MPILLSVRFENVAIPLTAVTLVLPPSLAPVGLLPSALAVPLSRLEPYGMLILIGVLIVLPLAGAQFGLNLDIISAFLRTSIGYVVQLLLLLTGNA